MRKKSHQISLIADDDFCWSWWWWWWLHVTHYTSVMYRYSIYCDHCILLNHKWLIQKCQFCFSSYLNDFTNYIDVLFCIWWIWGRLLFVIFGISCILEVSFGNNHVSWALQFGFTMYTSWRNFTLIVHFDHEKSTKPMQWMAFSNCESVFHWIQFNPIEWQL